MLHQPMTSELSKPVSPRTRRRGHGGRRQEALAPLPDPVREERAAIEGDRRARAVIDAATTVGESLLTRAGNPRSPITLPEYRRGRSPANKGKRYPAEILTPDEVQAIMAAMPAAGATGARNRALIAVLWRAGLRVAEALALLPKDVEPALGTITVLRGKGAKRRVVAIDRGAVTYVELWLRVRSTLGVLDDAPLFCTVTNDAAGPGRPLHASSVRELLKRAARKAGVRKRVHPHGLRHTHAFELSIEGVGAHLIQTQLGHESLEMTQHYIDHLVPAQLLERIGLRTWPGERPPTDPQTSATLSQGAPAASRGGTIPLRVLTGEPPEPEPMVRPKPAPLGEGAQRVLEAISTNGGRATQAQLRRALALRAPTILKHVHALQERGEIQRAGMDRNRSVIWKVAPPTARVRQTLDRPRRCPPNGEGPRRVLDALETLDGRASQAQLARLLKLDPTTISGHCRELEAHGEIERGGLDKSTSRRGSQIWRLRSTAEVSWAGSGARLLRLLAPDARAVSTTAG